MTILLPLPNSFQRSYEDFETYPGNLCQQITYPAALKAYLIRLDNASPTLFVEKDEEAYVPFRDYLGDGFERRNILSDGRLREWIGDQSTIDPQTFVQTFAGLTKKDPKCRFIFLWAGDSRKPLKITRKMFVRILSFHQVMTGFLDFISVFGSQSESRDLRFSGFREQLSLTTPPRAPEIQSMGRSGRQYQLCYNLKSVACLTPKVTRPKSKQWSIRQAAVHHQFDVEQGTTLWIIAKGDLALKDRIQDMTGVHGRPEDQAFGSPGQSFKSSLAVNLLLGHWSAEEWRWYIQWLEAVIEGETQLAVYGPRGPGEFQHEYTPENLQSVQHYEDLTNEAIMILEANADVLTSIRRFYERLVDNVDFPLGKSCREDVLAFTMQVDDMIYDSKMQIARAKVLVRITADRKNLVLQHLQSQATEKMEILTVKMHKIGILSQKEAIAMRIITVVTLIYLPATFVSTFFSTDVIKYQNQNQSGNNDPNSSRSMFNGSFSQVALKRWLQVTIPLTVLTLAIGYIAFKVADKKRKREGDLPFHKAGSKTSLTG